MWESMADLRNVSHAFSEKSMSGNVNFLDTKPYASKILNGQHLYVSLTTIHSRIYGIAGTIESILRGTIWPDHIYIFVSREPHLLDLGVTPEFILSESKGRLKELAHIYPRISVIFTDNIGPHRKLLPLLAKKWNEDCVIVTIDDHETYKKTTLESLIKYYDASGRNAVVALRARRMGICSDAPPWHVSPYTKNRKGLWPEASPSLREMLILPTGTGGVLYHPKFFHPIIFDRKLMNITKTGDDLMFRLSTLIMGIPVVTACAEIDALGRICPSKITSLINERMMKILPNMMDFTFNISYDIDSIRKEFRPPGMNTKGIPIINKPKTHIESDITTSNSTGIGNGNGNGIKSGSREVGTGENKKKHRSKYSKDFKTKGGKDKDQDQERAVSNLNTARDPSQRFLKLSELNENFPYKNERKSDFTMKSSSFTSKNGERNRNRRKLERNRRKLRRGLISDSIEWKNDPRKTESLASIFNTGGGNNLMWNHLLDYLYNERIIDFNLLLQSYAPMERTKCLLSLSVLSNKNSLGFGAFNHYINVIKIALQSSYEPQCGISICDIA